MSRMLKYPALVLCLAALAGVVYLRAQTVTSSVTRVNNLHVKSIVLTSTFYVHSAIGNDSNPGNAFAPWKTLGKLASVTFPVNAVVDGYGQVYNERLVVPTNSITIRNMTLDGTVSADGGWTYTNSPPVYTNNAAWTLVSGAIYKKDCSALVKMMTEDGNLMTPLVCADEADAVANLGAGQFSIITNTATLYYRASDGGAPATHTLRMPNHAWDTLDGLVYCILKTNVNLTGVRIQNFQPYRYAQGFYVVGCGNVIMTNCSSTNGHIAATIQNVTDSTFSFNAVSNIDDGASLFGNLTNIAFLNCTVLQNGRREDYNGSTLSFANLDKDGFGVGQTGCNFSNLVWGACNISSNGPPDSDSANNSGSGIYIGTGNTMQGNGVTITNCYFLNNHANGIYFSGDQTIGNKLITNNIFAWNGRTAAAVSWAGIWITDSLASQSWNVSYNLFYQNACKDSTACLLKFNPACILPLIVSHNAFVDNGQAGMQGDLRWSTVTPIGQANIDEHANTFQRTPSAWDTNTALIYLDVGSHTYNLNRIVGGSAGFWQFDASLGAGDIATTDSTIVNPTTLTFP